MRQDDRRNNPKSLLADTLNAMAGGKLYIKDDGSVETVEIRDVFMNYGLMERIKRKMEPLDVILMLYDLLVVVQRYDGVMYKSGYCRSFEELNLGIRRVSIVTRQMLVDHPDLLFKVQVERGITHSLTLMILGLHFLVPFAIGFLTCLGVGILL